jgi:hypothetical protein
VFYITKVVKMFMYSGTLCGSYRLPVCKRPSVRIRAEILPQVPAAATVCVDTAVISTYSHHVGRGPLEVNLTRTGTHMRI